MCDQKMSVWHIEPFLILGKSGRLAIHAATEACYFRIKPLNNMLVLSAHRVRVQSYTASVQ